MEGVSSSFFLLFIFPLSSFSFFFLTFFFFLSPSVPVHLLITTSVHRPCLHKCTTSTRPWTEQIFDSNISLLLSLLLLHLPFFSLSSSFSLLSFIFHFLLLLWSFSSFIQPLSSLASSFYLHGTFFDTIFSVERLCISLWIDRFVIESFEAWEFFIDSSLFVLFFFLSLSSFFSLPASFEWIILSHIESDILKGWEKMDQKYFVKN